MIQLTSVTGKSFREGQKIHGTNPQRTETWIIC